MTAACDRPMLSFYKLMSGLGTFLALLSVQAPLAAQTALVLDQSMQRVRQTSLRTIQQDTSSPDQQTRLQATTLPFRVRDPYVPPMTMAPAFPDATLPEPALEIRLVIRLEERRVYLYRGSTIETSYPIAIGRQGWETPTGQYEVLNMIENPEWQNPFTGEVIAAGPSNPLGERWIGFWTDGNNFIGFHGTPNEQSVGQAASHGCIRMYNHHVRELYALVALGTSVTVEY